MTPLPPLFDDRGRHIRLGREIGRGGEGEVFEVAGDENRVAKLYHRPSETDQAAKLARMIELGVQAAELVRISAWPITSLRAGQASGPLRGFLMPRVAQHQPIHHLYGPASRKQHFPAADFAFLVRAAMNCAAALDTIHEQGIVVADINQGNMLVSRQATVRWIDCDSFQVPGENEGRPFRCAVGVPEFTPPELQCVRFAEVDRTPNHDSFGLAELVFQLLFMGRHPFCGRFLGRGDLPLEQAIAEYRFAFSRSGASLEMEPPPHALPIESVSAELADLFERAFRRGSDRPHARPTPRQFREALARFEKSLRVCPRKARHHVPKDHLGDCPWCAIVRGGGPDFFPALPKPRPTPRFSLDKAWKAIEHVVWREHEYRKPPEPVVKARPMTLEVAAAKSYATWRIVAGVAVCVSLLLLFTDLRLAGWVIGLISAVTWLGLFASVRPDVWERERLRAAIREAQAKLAAADEEWLRRRETGRAAFEEKDRQLRAWRAEYLGLDRRLELDRGALEARKEALQRDAFLRGKLIADQDIPRIGAARKVTLASYGIETAVDIDERRIELVPGFGPVLTRELVEWRARLLRNFRFNPRTAIPPEEVRALEDGDAALREELQARLRNGASELIEIVSRADAELRAAERDVGGLVMALAQARADAAAC